MTWHNLPAEIPIFYEDDSVVLIHADCRDILPLLPKVDLVLTDPPYGIDYDTSHSKYKNGIARDKIAEDATPFDASMLPPLGRAILWGGNCFFSSLPPSKLWLCWCKTARDDVDIRQSDIELAWTNCVGRSRIFHHLWIGAFKASESGERANHPTQKPVALMKWCIGLVKDANLILDPFCGSGTTLVAAKQLGRKAIGVEISEAYCKIAVERLKQEILV